MTWLSVFLLCMSGASPGFGRGAKNFLFRFGNLHVALRFARGVRANDVLVMLPSRLHLKTCHSTTQYVRNEIDLSAKSGVIDDIIKIHLNIVLLFSYIGFFESTNTDFI